MATTQKQKGITSPISTKLPTESEIATNDALIAELKSRHNFEGTEDTERRYPCCTHPDASRLRMEQEDCFGPDTEDHGGVCEARQQDEKLATSLYRLRRRKDLHLWKLSTGRLWTRYDLHSMIRPKGCETKTC